jgi:hypothetical protein
MTEPRYRLSDFNEIASDLTANNGAHPTPDSWTPINLANDPETPPTAPELGGFGIVYRGKRHVFSGPQESAKTLAAYAIGLETIRIDHGWICILDFEMGRRSARIRLRELGATNDELARIMYLEPETPATPDRISALIGWQPELVIIDAAAGAYSMQGLDDNHRADVEKFASLYVAPFYRAEIATLVLDHVVKNTESRGKYAIGSERKTGGVDVHLGFDTILPIKRGSTGIYKVTTQKDRDGWHERGRLADLHLTSHPDTHQITWEWRQAEHHEDPSSWMPTIYMERVSKYLHEDGEACSRKNIEDNVEGGTDYIRQAIDALKRLGFITETKGPRKARLFTHHTIFTETEWEKDPRSTTSPHLATTSPQANSIATSPPRLPLTGGSERGRGATTPENTTTSPDSWIDELTPKDYPPEDLYD